MTHPHHVLREACVRFEINIVQLLSGPDAHPRAWAAQQIVSLGYDKHETAKFLGNSPKTIVEWMRRHPDVQSPPPPWREQDWSKCIICKRSPTVGLGLCSAHKQRHRKSGNLDINRPVREMGVIAPSESCNKDALSYRRGCRCEDCRWAATRIRKTQRAYGPVMTELHEVHEHIDMLMEAGLTVSEIARRSGVRRERVSAWKHRYNKTGRADLARKILAVQVPCASCGRPSLANGKWCWPCFTTNVRAS